jgi:hypothetical protein
MVIIMANSIRPQRRSVPARNAALYPQATPHCTRRQRRCGVKSVYYSTLNSVEMIAFCVLRRYLQFFTCFVVTYLFLR